MIEKIRFSGISRKFLFWFVLVSVTPFLIGLSVITMQMMSSARQTISTELSVVRDMKIDQIRMWLEESYRSIEQTLEETVYVLARTVESRDPYTAGHQKRVAELGLAMAGKMGFSDFGQKSVYMSSHRPYRAALGLEEALAEVSNRSGDLYDPDAVQSCLELFEKDRFMFPEVNPL